MEYKLSELFMVIWKKIDTERIINVQGVFLFIIFTFLCLFHKKKKNKDLNYFESSSAPTHFLFVVFFSTQAD